MKRLKGFQNDSTDAGCVLSIGNFDGVHRGHQAILARLVASAKSHAVPAVVMTFEPHPAALLNPARQPPRLTTADQKADLMAAQGVDILIEYPTDWDLLKLTPREFFDQIVMNQLNAAGLVEGPNFFFGHNREGNVETLAEFCRESGRLLEVVRPTLFKETIVSSSLIRKALISGEVKRAADLLGREYALSGVVAPGAQRGRTIGFPTANIEQIETLIPADGVYAVQCLTSDGDFPAAVSIGPNPTFSDGNQKVEAHLIGFSGDLYEKEIELRFFERIRDLRHFESSELLQKQIRSDVQSIQVLFDDSSEKLH